MRDEVKTSSAPYDGSEHELRLLARELERRIDGLLTAAGHGRAPAENRLERLERYIAGMSAAQRLRLAAALHLLSPRLGGDLGSPDLR
jgi:hypothetical protein